MGTNQITSQHTLVQKKKTKDTHTYRKKDKKDKRKGKSQSSEKLNRVIWLSPGKKKSERLKN